MKLLTQVIKDLRGLVTEPVRAAIANRFMLAIAQDVSVKVSKSVGRRWPHGAGAKFLRDCDLDSGAPVVPDDFHVEATELAMFIDKWMAVQQYKSDDGWAPLTSDMNSIRVTIIEELKEIGHSSNGSL